MSDASGTLFPGNFVTATAIGDLDGDNVYSSFQLFGVVENGALKLAPAISENKADE